MYKGINTYKESKLLNVYKIKTLFFLHSKTLLKMICELSVNKNVFLNKMFLLNFLFNYITN